MCSTKPYYNDSSVKILQEYIRIDTSKEKNIERAVNFWKNQADSLGLPFAVYRPSGKPICVITLRGRKSKLPSIILNSHMDVVPAAEQNWTYPPFSAHIDDRGKMFGRGTQDTKTLGITYLEAVKTLMKSGIKLRRTIHLLFMPDEESGGLNGMIPFIETKAFKDLNPGFFFDEGMASPDDTVYVLYQDKRHWQINLTLYGDGGHASTLPKRTAVEKLRRLLDITSEFRDQQIQIKLSNDPTDYGSYTSINVDIIRGGIVANVIPSQITVVIDMRLAISAQICEVEAMIQKWISEVGNDTNLSFIAKVDVAKPTRLDATNPYWVAVEDALKDKGIKFLPIVFPAASDMVSIRNRGFPAIGLAYLPRTELLFHDRDEYVQVKTFLKGIQVYTHILQKVCNLL
ncbi:PREDICTED: aminoacylase-1B-like [Papilio xuthus]|uniref:Aminoacylase-1B-like n=1 Tax=Papilio xuthus TaxID=66420 RepID=A0AAJ7EFK0_PAPXU|nr:PREDICTED: aminoacylase-1B-like [Papilio xuthus]